MATKPAVSKTQAVRDYLNAHPGAGCREIATALDQQGIKVTLGHVATVKAVIDAAKEATESAAPTTSPAVEKPPVTDMLTPDQLKKVAQAIKRIRSSKVPNT